MSFDTTLAQFREMLPKAATSRLIALTGSSEALEVIVNAEYQAEDPNTWLQRHTIEERVGELHALVTGEIDLRIPPRAMTPVSYLDQEAREATDHCEAISCDDEGNDTHCDNIASATTEDNVRVCHFCAEEFRRELFAVYPDVLP